MKAGGEWGRAIKRTGDEGGRMGAGDERDRG